ncbi:hypothetical protein TNCV_2431141 [Trichonephila clavipes]|nr:hypothetical protein TNCV_2431141 [Trichonephila clavipes]
MDLTWGILEKGNASIKRPTSYRLRPRLMHLPRQTKTFEQHPGPFSKKKRVFITPVIRPSVADPVLIARPTALSAPQPDTPSDDTIDPSTRSTFADNISDSFTRSTTRVDNISYSFTRSTCGRDFGADPYG